MLLYDNTNKVINLINNFDTLEKEGLHIESKRTGTLRMYEARYEEPIDDYDE